MKKNISLLLYCVLGLTMLFVSCKPKQSNYKSIYEAAKEREGVQPENDYSNYETTTSAMNPSVSSTEVVENMSTTVRKEQITVVNSQDANNLKTYSVVIAAMGMKPNAEVLQENMMAAGYRTILAQNPEGMYRVIIASTNTKDEAVKARRDILDAFKSKADLQTLRKMYSIPFNDWWILERQN